MTGHLFFSSPVTALAVLFVLTGCLEPPASRELPPESSISPSVAPQTIEPSQNVCLATATTPAVVETVTEQVLVQAANVENDEAINPDAPATFRTITRQRIVRERREVEFEIPCADVQTPEFLASVQRALLARGYYLGPITGQQNAALASAVLRFQTDQGDIQTGQLTLRTARALGLVALPRDEL